MASYVENMKVSFDPSVDNPTIDPSAFKGWPKTIRTQVQAFAERADTLANEILHRKEDGDQPSSNRERTVIIRNYYNPWYTPFFWSPWPQPVYVVSHDSHRRDNDNDIRVLVGLVAAVVGGIALFAVGAAIPRYHDSEHELENTHEFQQRLQETTIDDGDAALIEEAKTAAFFKERVCKRIRNSALADLALRITISIGCGMALGAALTVGSGAFMVAGIVTAFVGGGAMLFKWGLESSDKRNIRDSQALLASVARLHTL